MAQSPQGTPAPAPIAPAVAGAVSPGPAAPTALGPGAGFTAVKHGGLRGGKPRKDGLVPGSAEAQQADRKKDKLRKRAERGDPPALPSAGPVESPPEATAAPLGAVPGPEGAPVVPWLAEDLKEASDLLVDVVEEIRADAFESKCIEAHIPAVTVKELLADRKWPDKPKTGVQRALARVSAKWLNRFHVPSGAQDELILVGCAAALIKHDHAAMKRLDELIAKANPPAQPSEKKEGAA